VVATLRTRIDDLETALSAASAEFRTQNEPVTLANVQAALPSGAMLVEFVRYHRFDARAQSPQQEERYVAYLVTSHGPPRWVPSGKPRRSTLRLMQCLPRCSPTSAQRVRGPPCSTSMPS